MGVLREARIKKGLKQREVAYHCNVSIRYYQHWEEKDYVPRTLDALKVSKFLRVPVKEMAGE